MSSLSYFILTVLTYINGSIKAHFDIGLTAMFAECDHGPCVTSSRFGNFLTQDGRGESRRVPAAVSPLLCNHRHIWNCS